MKKVAVNKELTDKQSERLNKYPELLRHLLFYRDQKTNEEAERFLTPDWVRDTFDPFLIKGMKVAVERILRAIDSNEKIVIYSDYDADGIPGGVILHDYFRKIGYTNFSNYIPHRHLEGFGLNHEAVIKFIEDGVNLIITVDCGIADVEEVKHAKDAGVDMIITDHHLPGEVLPEAVAILDSKQADCKYPEKMLAGAGVAFKLVQALLKTKDFGIKEGWEKWLLDMVGIATLSDMVPLVGENRTFASYGLMVLRKTPRVGLQKLFKVLKIDQRNLVEDDIGFSISPRINAASRMGNPDDAFKLFATQDEGEAEVYAKHLDKINNERKGLVASMVKEVRKIIGNRYGIEEGKACPNLFKGRVIVIGNPEWRPGLLGLVANNLVDEHSCPVFLWGREGGTTLKGSCRSDGSVNLVTLMSEVEEGIFDEFGGHGLSGGFAVAQTKVHLLEEKLTAAYERLLARGLDEKEEVKIDRRLKLEEVNFDTYNLVSKLAPFGVGNPKPTFLFEQIKIVSAKHFGKEGNHLELTFKDENGRVIKAISFFAQIDSWGIPLQAGMIVDLVATIEKNTFGRANEIRLRIIDVIC